VSTEGGAGRWWENYLVRYFMPSVAGIAIVAWLLAWAPAQLREILFFGAAPHSIDAPTLTLLILYGNLFCYVASYPVLCFHVSRVIDFEGYTWKVRPTDGYLAAAAVGLLTLSATLFLSGVCRVVAIFLITMLFSVLQVIRFGLALRRQKLSGNPKGRPTSLLYAYRIDLSKRRGVTVQRQSMASPLLTDVEVEHEPKEQRKAEEKEDGGRSSSTAIAICENTAIPRSSFCLN
jgi:hypothetical protein